jgi:hypothetical protein
MAGKTDYLANAVLNHILRGVSFSSPGTVYLGLFSSAPTDSTPGTELSVTGYARQPITFSAPVSGTSANSAGIDFGTPETNWGFIRAVGIFDALSGGNLLFSAVISTKSAAAGSPVQVQVGDITIVEE